MKGVSQMSDSETKPDLLVEGQVPVVRGEPKLDPFDPASLRLSQDYASVVGVKKALLTVPVRKPAKEWWVRTHPDDNYQLSTAVIDLKEEGETYLVAQPLWPALAAESTFSPRAFFLAVNRQQVVFFWPVRLPGSDGKLDDWSRSAMQAAVMARKQWVRVTSNMSLGAYEVSYSTATWDEPEWPTQSMTELLKTAFKDRHIDSFDHPILKRLRGEA
ncbi:MAG: hypothetical protein JNM56_05425 [Planctomycetia bacterium]|nr:hypothetical protein [Planctomycetia bacterium]